LGEPGTGTQRDLNQYVAKLSKATGLKATDTLTPDFLAGPGGIAFAKSQSAAEGPGKQWGGYPMTDDEWKQAQDWGIWGQKPSGQQFQQGGPVQKDQGYPAQQLPYTEWGPVTPSEKVKGLAAVYQRLRTAAPLESPLWLAGLGFFPTELHKATGQLGKTGAEPYGTYNLGIRSPGERRPKAPPTEAFPDQEED
jgi:hypothetical protein